MATATERTTNRLHSSMANLGFTRSQRGEDYRHNGMTCKPEGAWSTLYGTEPLVGVDPLQGMLGRPGLGKYVVGPDGTVRTTIDVPTAVLDLRDEDDDLDDQETPLVAALKWALATERGVVPAGWRAPERLEIDGWMTPQALTIQCGPIMLQGAVILSAERLALRFPIVQSLPPGLSENRMLWLREVLVEGQNRWRMVRIGLTENGADAEIDLTGAPPMIVEPLFKASVDALRWVVGWLALSAGLLADPAVACRAWEVCPLRAEPAGRRDTP